MTIQEMQDHQPNDKILDIILVWMLNLRYVDGGMNESERKTAERVVQLFNSPILVMPRQP